MEIYSVKLTWMSEDRQIIEKETLYDSLEAAKEWAAEFEWQFAEKNMPMRWTVWRMESEDGVFDYSDDIESGEVKPLDIPEPMDDEYVNKKGASINSIKAMIRRNFGKPLGTFEESGYDSREFYDEDNTVRSEAIAVVEAIAGGEYGVATEIAKAALKYHRMTEKQAYWIAKSAWENEIDCIYTEDGVKSEFGISDYDEYLYS